MADGDGVRDIVTKLGDSNRLMSELIGKVIDRTNTWQLANPLPVSQGGTGAVDAASARAALGLAIGSDVQAYIAALNLASIAQRAVIFNIDGGGAEILTGVAGDLSIPFACTINEVTLLADQNGSVVVDIWKTTYASFPPTNANSITASATPTISSADTYNDSTLTGWTTSIAAGDTLRFNVDSVTTIEKLSITLKVTLA